MSPTNISPLFPDEERQKEKEILIRVKQKPNDLESGGNLKRGKKSTHSFLWCNYTHFSCPVSQVEMRLKKGAI